ncbi:hypothetical protein Avbf_07405 [Armadillidium vulgare]|nr:hypothetical protein Avbf_07405 [Armadillidium vulgare]
MVSYRRNALQKEEAKCCHSQLRNCAHLNYSSANNSDIQGIFNSTYSSHFKDTYVNTSLLTHSIKSHILCMELLAQCYVFY